MSSNSINEILKVYTSKWKWFLFSVFIAFSLAFLYIRYSVPEYEARAKIQILEEQKSSELSAFTDLGVLGGAKNLVEDEIEILNSRSNFLEVVKELSLNVKVTALGNLKNSEIYQNIPIKINFIANDSVIDNSKFEFYLELNSDSAFGFSLEKDSPGKIYSFGKNIPTEIGEIIVTPNVVYYNKYKGQQLKVSVSPIFTVAENYQNSILITPSNDMSNIIDLSLTDPIKQKAIDIINTLIQVYNRNAIQSKKQIADKTSEFINNRIELIAGNLTNVDEDAEELLTKKGITGQGLEVGAAVQSSAASRQQLENARVQLQVVSGMKEYVENENGYDQMPVVDVGNAAIAATTAKYNELVAERNRLLKSADERNPMIVNLDEQLNALKANMQSSLMALENNVGMNVSTLQNQMGRIQGTIYSAPENQRELRNITRQQQTTESLYLYLLQKREESQITAASSPEKSAIIDKAHQVGSNPVKPKIPMVYMASFILGLLIPFSIIYVRDLMDNKVHNKLGLEKVVGDIPVLAELPKITKKGSRVILKDDRSVLAESLRILRTNLDYLLNSNSPTSSRGKVVFVTSSVPGEGKTFLSSNLSMILASTDKRVLLIGGDIRNPKIHSFFTGENVDRLDRTNRKDNIGLTEYLFRSSVEVKDIINPMLVHTNSIDVIYSGKIPPNPAELLMTKRMGELFDEVTRLYDYVIVDTAPMVVVADTLLISEYADKIIYVTRAGVTEEKILEFPLKLCEEGKLKGLCFVVNDVKENNLGYGGKYGYGYGKTTKKWWKFG